MFCTAKTDGKFSFRSTGSNDVHIRAVFRGTRTCIDTKKLGYRACSMDAEVLIMENITEHTEIRLG
jgi:hypothetical protein